jgi:hypothetical protein
MSITHGPTYTTRAGAIAPPVLRMHRSTAINGFGFVKTDTTAASWVIQAVPITEVNFQK